MAALQPVCFDFGSPSKAPRQCNMVYVSSKKNKKIHYSSLWKVDRSTFAHLLLSACRGRYVCMCMCTHICVECICHSITKLDGRWCQASWTAIHIGNDANKQRNEGWCLISAKIGHVFRSKMRYLTIYCYAGQNMSHILHSRARRYYSFKGRSIIDLYVLFSFMWVTLYYLFRSIAVSQHGSLAWCTDFKDGFCTTAKERI